MNSKVADPDSETSGGPEMIDASGSALAFPAMAKIVKSSGAPQTSPVGAVGLACGLFEIVTSI